MTVGDPDNPTPDNPTDALLVVEVSDSRLAYDRGDGDKASLYAAAGVKDYWILNLIDRQLEVHRDYTADGSWAFGVRYDSVTILKPGDAISPLAAPHAAVAVADLLP